MDKVIMSWFVSKKKQMNLGWPENRHRTIEVHMKNSCGLVYCMVFWRTCDMHEIQNTSAKHYYDHCLFILPLFPCSLAVRANKTYRPPHQLSCCEGNRNIWLCVRVDIGQSGKNPFRNVTLKATQMWSKSMFGWWWCLWAKRKIVYWNCSVQPQQQRKHRWKSE